MGLFSNVFVVAVVQITGMVRANSMCLIELQVVIAGGHGEADYKEEHNTA